MMTTCFIFSDLFVLNFSFASLVMLMFKLAGTTNLSIVCYLTTVSLLCMVTYMFLLISKYLCLVDAYVYSSAHVP